MTTATRSAAVTGALLSRPRLWVDLLSSQPLCFNLFAPLAEDLRLATAALQLMWPHLITRVTEIRFEWSPGRADDHYTGNRSAFDVFVAVEGPNGRAFVGIEVKYHEDLTGQAARHVDRYVDIARGHGVFHNDSLDVLRSAPLQQLWLDHLLALQLRASERDGWHDGIFVLLFPTGNLACARAARRYRDQLTGPDSFDARTLDEMVQAIRLCTAEQWIDDVYDRYLDPRHLTRAGLPPLPAQGAGRR